MLKLLISWVVKLHGNVLKSGVDKKKIYFYFKVYRDCSELAYPHQHNLLMFEYPTVTQITANLFQEMIYHLMEMLKIVVTLA